MHGIRFSSDWAALFPEQQVELIEWIRAPNMQLLEIFEMNIKQGLLFLRVDRTF